MEIEKSILQLEWIKKNIPTYLWSYDYMVMVRVLIFLVRSNRETKSIGELSNAYYYLDQIWQIRIITLIIPLPLIYPTIDFIDNNIDYICILGILCRYLIIIKVCNKSFDFGHDQSTY